jgi:transcriptional regulator of arginine metabolism
MQKTERLLAIEKIITEGSISSQDELLKKLKGKGMDCTQATLSRNLRQLGVSRGPDGRGGYMYFLPDINNNRGAVRPAGKLNIVTVINDIIEAKGLMVMKTMPGNASATAFFIDGSGRYEIAGTIAGDDTILIIPRDGVTLHQVHDSLEIILPGLHKQIKKR